MSTSAETEGYNEGLIEGRSQGFHSGVALGLVHGSSLGSELGFYHGFACMWKEFETLKKKPRERLLRICEALIGLIKSFPKDDPKNDEIQEKVQNIRAKFKQICSILKVSVNSSESEKGVSF